MVESSCCDICLQHQRCSFDGQVILYYRRQSRSVSNTYSSLLNIHRNIRFFYNWLKSLYSLSDWEVVAQFRRNPKSNRRKEFGEKLQTQMSVAECRASTRDSNHFECCCLREMERRWARYDVILHPNRILLKDSVD